MENTFSCMIVCSQHERAVKLKLEDYDPEWRMIDTWALDLGRPPDGMKSQ